MKFLLALNSRNSKKINIRSFATDAKGGVSGSHKGAFRATPRPVARRPLYIPGITRNNFRPMPPAPSRWAGPAAILGISSIVVGAGINVYTAERQAKINEQMLFIQQKMLELSQQSANLDPERLTAEAKIKEAAKHEARRSIGAADGESKTAPTQTAEPTKITSNKSDCLGNADSSFEFTNNSDFFLDEVTLPNELNPILSYFKEISVALEHMLALLVILGSLFLFFSLLLELKNKYSSMLLLVIPNHDNPFTKLFIDWQPHDIDPVHIAVVTPLLFGSLLGILEGRPRYFTAEQTVLCFIIMFAGLSIIPITFMYALEASCIHFFYWYISAIFSTSYIVNTKNGRAGIGLIVGCIVYLITMLLFSAFVLVLRNLM